MRLSPTLQRTTVYAVFFLFFFQLLADFVEAIYAFGLLGTNIPPEIVAVLLFFSPLLLLLWRCLLYTSPSPRDRTRSRMPSSA